MTGALLAALLSGVAAVDRKALLQLQLSRPIVVGPLVGWALGDPLGGLFVGAPLELLWIGAANLGAALPPHETAASAAIAAAAVAAAQGAEVDGAIAAVSFLVFAPVSLLGRRLEALGERANEHLVGKAAVLLGEGRTQAAMRLHVRALWRPFFASFLLVALAALVAGPLLSRLRLQLPPFVVEGLGYGWALVWAAGAATCVRAARLPRGPALAFVGFALALALWLLRRGG